MAGSEIIDVRAIAPSAEYAAPFTAVTGGSSSKFAHPDDSSIWIVTADLEPGTTLEWGDAHGDELVFVQSGRLTHADGACGPFEVAIVESGVATALVADGPTSIVHFGSVSPEPPADGHFGAPVAEGHSVHFLGEHGRYFSNRGTEVPNEVFYADSTCPTCRVTLLRNSAPADTRVASHTHSEDEIIYMLRGDVQVGGQEVVPGMALSVVGNFRYGFRTETGCEFLNFRRDVSWFTRDPKSPPMLETLEETLALFARMGLTDDAAPE
jgi:quercetin dioxygenase-like cupin family protein